MIMQWEFYLKKRATNRDVDCDNLIKEGASVSEQGLEVLDSSYQKTQEWIGSLATQAHLDKSDAYKALRAVLLTLRDRLPMEEAVHFGAQLPMMLRGLDQAAA
jgi:hypothetical protein